MKKHTWLVLALIVCVCAFTLWTLFDHSGDVNGDQTLATQLNDSQPTASLALVEKQAKKKALFEVDQEDEFNPFDDDALKAQLQQVSDIYAENIKYPITSQPIRNPEDVREYEEFEQAEVDLPFPDGDNDDNPIRIAASTNTFQYFEGDVVNVRVQITGAPEDTFIQVNGVLSGGNGDLPIEGVFDPSDRSLTQFVAAFDTKLAPPNSLTPEMLVKLNVTVGDRPLFTTVAFRYAVASAQIVGVQQVRTEGPNLVMPLQLNVFQSGYYFVSGVLEDAQTGRPLVQLQAEQRLVQGNGIINLAAHIAALRQQASEGPYVLRSLTSYRGSEVGESFDAPASTSQARFNVRGFPFTAYDDEEHVDEAGQDTLDFLEDFGSTDEGTQSDQ